jgi:drug/metabolite transporter (DMT)-like permease
VTLLSLTGISAYNTIAYYGLQYTQAINALLIASTGPLLVAAATFAIYGDRPTSRQVMGVCASLAGVLVVIARGDLEVLRQLQVNAGDIWFFLAQIVYAIYTALLRKRPPIHPFSFALVTIGWGAVMLTPLLLVEIAFGRAAVWDAASFATLAYIVVFPSLVAYIFYNRGVELVGPNRAAPFYHLIPLFGSVLAIVFLGERLQIYHGVGYLLIFTGVAIATTTTRGRALRTSTASPAAPAVAPAPSQEHQPARHHRPRSRR